MRSKPFCLNSTPQSCRPDGRNISYVHRFEKGTEADARSLLLLHGTGGDENDLVPLGRMVAPGAPLLSVRGKVLENGMPRCRHFPLLARCVIGRVAATRPQLEHKPT